MSVAKEQFSPPKKQPYQAALPLRFGEGRGHAPPVPARILNEFVYCPRLAYLEWVQKEWADSSDTVEGKRTHRRVDQQSGQLPDPFEEVEDIKIARSVELSSRKLNLVAKIDLVESKAGIAVPIDYKRGKRPHTAKNAYDPERVQLCAQGLLLEEHGYTCTEGVLYFAASKERVKVPFDHELRALTLDSLARLQSVVDGGRIPPPLEKSPKCPRCSLVGICLPDEINLLQAMYTEVRPISVRRTHAMPVYVQENRAKVAISGERLVISVGDEKQAEARLGETSQLVVMGNTYVTTPTIHELMRRDIPITWMSYGGWFLGHTVGAGHANVELRTAQYRASFDDRKCLNIARGLVQSKIRNCRVLLRRNWQTQPDDQDKADVLLDLKRLAERAGRTQEMETLLGIEGAAAAKYFQSFSNLLRPKDALGMNFDMLSRNRRPPTDPVNAMLSFGYAMLTRTFVTALSATGFDVYRGFYHQPRYGRPALALDLMEPFRPLIVDSTVMTVINTGTIKAADFVTAPTGVNLTASGRKRFIAAFERRLTQEATHPIFEYRIEYRRMLTSQSRLLGRYLLGEIPNYPNFITR